MYFFAQHLLALAAQISGYFNVGSQFRESTPSVCRGKNVHDLCLPEVRKDAGRTLLDVVFPFATIATPGTFKEGGTVYMSMCMYAVGDHGGKCYTVTTDEHDSSLQHRQAGHEEVLWENALLVPCELPNEGKWDAGWMLRVVDRAHFGLDRTWRNTTLTYGPFDVVPSCGL